MESRPRLKTDTLPSVSEDAVSSTASPARGKPRMTQVFSNIRQPIFQFVWEFWHEKPADSNDPAPFVFESDDPSETPSQPESAEPPKPSGPPPPPKLEITTTTSSGYSVKLSRMSIMSDAGSFWRTLNNAHFDLLKQRQAYHLFHAQIRPFWEDTRNARGGAWYFRVPKSQAIRIYTEVCVLAVGEQLEYAVNRDQPKEQRFRDEICGVSIRPKFASTIISVWNRDAGHETGKERLLNRILQEFNEELRPKEGSYYYKRHAEQEGFDPNLLVAVESEELDAQPKDEGEKQ